MIILCLSYGQLVSPWIGSRVELPSVPQGPTVLPFVHASLLSIFAQCHAGLGSSRPSQKI